MEEGLSYPALQNFKPTQGENLGQLSIHRVLVKPPELRTNPVALSLSVSHPLDFAPDTNPMPWKAAEALKGLKTRPCFLLLSPHNKLGEKTLLLLVPRSSSNFLEAFLASHSTVFRTG